MWLGWRDHEERHDTVWLEERLARGCEGTVSPVKKPHLICGRQSAQNIFKQGSHMRRTVLLDGNSVSY